MFVFRMHKAGREVFDTTGSFLFPGRWHTPGNRIVYTAENVSLATLEVLVHAQARKLPPMVLTRIEVPDSISVESAAWIDAHDSQEFGDRWIAEERTAVLRVPSIVADKLESNLLLNPGHADFAGITPARAQAFTFDPRFFLLP
jgi:RES domain-containing protein